MRQHELERMRLDLSSDLTFVKNGCNPLMMLLDFNVALHKYPYSI